MAGLDGEDGASSGEVGLAHDIGSGTEVSRDTDTLKNGSGGKEGLDVLVAEFVLALSDGSDTSGCNTY